MNKGFGMKELETGNIREMLFDLGPVGRNVFRECYIDNSGIWTSN